jgi:hypothetical protein
MQGISGDKEPNVFLQPRGGGKKHDHIASVSAKVEGRAYDVSSIWYALVCPRLMQVNTKAFSEYRRWPSSSHTPPCTWVTETWP